MKLRTKLLISSAFVLPLLSANTVWARNMQVAVEDSTTTSSSSSTSSTDESAEAKLTMQQRLTAREAKLKVTLAAVDKLRIQTKCVAAQSVIKGINTRSVTADTARISAYTGLDSRLGKLITKLKAAKVDTTTLEAERTVLETKIKTFNTDMASYKLAVSDLAAMDCKTDPVAFQASLLTARTDRTQVATDVLEIRNYWLKTIKPTLQDIRKTLAAKDSSSTSDDSTTDTTTGGTQ